MQCCAPFHVMVVNYLLFLNNILVSNSLTSQLCRNACQRGGSVFWGWNLIKESVWIKWHPAFSWCLKGLTHCKQNLGRGRVSYLFYWFSICEALYIYTVCDCTLIAQAGNQIANHITGYCDYPTHCHRKQAMCHSMCRTLLKICRQSPLCASNEAEEMCWTISFDFPVQVPGMPDWFSTVPEDQHSRAPPTIGLHVQLLSTILKLGKIRKKCWYFPE